VGGEGLGGSGPGAEHALPDAYVPAKPASPQRNELVGSKMMNGTLYGPFATLRLTPSKFWPASIVIAYVVPGVACTLMVADE
jgi:hypothetical protein